MSSLYKCDYALNNESSCKVCRTTIDENTLRIAAVVEYPCWYHFECFFEKTDMRPNLEEIEGFSGLKLEEQQKLEEKVDSRSTFIPGIFLTETSRSSESKCRKCNTYIALNEIRIAKKNFNTAKAKRIGGIPMWHHLNCFKTQRRELGYYLCGDELPGFQKLNAANKQKLLLELPAIDEKSIIE